jgi:hypothetical protein
VTSPRTSTSRRTRSETVPQVPAGQHPVPVVVSLSTPRTGTAAETTSETTAGTAPAGQRRRGRPPAPARPVSVAPPGTAPLTGTQRQQAITALAALIRQWAGTCETTGETTRKAA